MISSRGLLALLALTSGCYFYYPKNVPKLNGALMVEGEQITFSTRESKDWTHCSNKERDAGKCEYVGTTWRRYYPVYFLSASYAGRTLTKGEFYELTMPEFPAMVRKVGAQKGTCNLSLIPTALAVASAIATIGLPTLASTTFDDGQKETIFYVGAAATVGFAVLSYPVGGFACVKARSLSKEMLEESSKKSWRSAHKSEFADIEKLASDFNSGRVGSSTPPAVDAPPADALTADIPTGGALEPVVGTSLLDVMKTSGQFTLFLRALEAVGGTAWLTDEGPYTVFAPTNTALKKLSEKERDMIFGVKGISKDKLQALWLHHFVPGSLTSDALVDKTSLDPQAGSKLRVKRKDGTLKVGKGIVTEPGLPAPNGIVYPIDEVLR